MISPIKVSVCIPTYEQSDYFLKTIKSVLDQDFINYEIIITDDSRNNSIKNVVEKLMPNTKIKYFENKQRKGSPGNWNEAIHQASGEYIKILHHDDWFTRKDSLSIFVNMLDSNPEADFGFCPSLICDPNQKAMRINSATDDQLLKVRNNPLFLLYGNFIGAPSATIFKRKLSLSYDSNLKWLVDMDFYINILKDNNKFSYYNEPLICTTSGAAHQITAKCENNMEIELKEYIYLYGKYKYNSRPNIDDIKLFANLVRKYKISSILEIKNIVGNTYIPEIIHIPIIIFKFVNYYNKLK
jgi:glycosyltransferase involved in cell wall biosynthesis